ncbi:MAG TPA: hypothetical protein VL992_07685, partial [Tepidisphaeraceae bacterium]|nr:hypothetical protein [Tepidisphaeraceae bacterium]
AAADYHTALDANAAAADVAAGVESASDANTNTDSNASDAGADIDADAGSIGYAGRSAGRESAANPVQ